MDYNLSEDQQLKYFCNFFGKDASRFFCEKVQEHCESYGISNTVIIAYFSNINRLNRIRQYLQTINLQGVM